ncbi:MAG TPA: GNAT family N-acetyltransferase [Patescibacteria group bacterium]|jgi:ribosomal protein S18 acetylase RimI-like enzyme|nr:GNAT family N-acetyltransferase [Patescibacteria group bacterium]
MTYSTHKLKQEDLSSFVDLWNQDPEALATSKRVMTLDLAQDGFKENYFDYYFGLYENNKLIGFILIKNIDDNIWLKHMLIDNGERGKGLGKMFLSEVLKIVNNRILTEVVEDNDRAKKFYIDNGFREIRFDQESRDYILEYIPSLI